MYCQATWTSSLKTNEPFCASKASDIQGGGSIITWRGSGSHFLHWGGSVAGFRSEFDFDRKYIKNRIDFVILHFLFREPFDKLNLKISHVTFPISFNFANLCLNELGSDLDPDPWKIFLIRQNDANPLWPDPQHALQILLL